VAVLVELHVPAKRYLVTVSPEYAEALSAVSVATLAAQGGPLTPGEVATFYPSPHWSDALTLRRADDAAKVPGRRVPGLDHWLPALRRVARGAR
jgi:predicted HD phosphohydrolase